MACVDSIHLDDVGTSLEFEIVECNNGVEEIVDLTNASNITIRFVKFNGEILDVIGGIYTGGTNGDATDGIVQYITQIGDIDVIGKWKAQVIITFINDSKYSSSIDKSIKVIENL